MLELSQLARGASEDGEGEEEVEVEEEAALDLIDLFACQWQCHFSSISRPMADDQKDIFIYISMNNNNKDILILIFIHLLNLSVETDAPIQEP